MPRSSTCTFRSPRGHDLSARLDHPDGTVHATAVFAHVFTGSKDRPAARRLTRALADRGFEVLSFDFTGLGRSGGDFSETTFSSDVEDLMAAARYLAETSAPPSLLVGHSLGGAAALTAAARMDGIEAVATIGSPADADHVLELFDEDLDTVRAQGEARVTLAGRPFTIRSEFVEDLREQRLLRCVEELDAALLFLHAPLDNIVGIDNAAMLFRAARHPKSFVSLADSDHLLTDAADAQYAADVIAAWASRYVAAIPTGDGSGSALPRGTGSYDDTGAAATTTTSLQSDVDTRGFRLRVDEPTSAGGHETGPTPYDYLGAALASCTSMTVRMYADRKGLPLDAVHTTVTFDRVHADDCERCETEEGRIELFTRTVSLEGDLDDEARQKLLGIAGRCPVHRTLEGTIEVHTTLADG